METRMPSQSAVLLHRALCLLLVCAASLFPSAANSYSFSDDFYVTWGAPKYVKLSPDAQVMQLLLDNSSASGFASKHSFLYGSIDMQIKLVPGNSAGTVTAYYLSSETSKHDELDFEFLGNETGEPYILQTNVFSNGVGGREQRIYLWFDPSADYHTYSVLWNQQHIIFSVDGIPIREFANNEAVGVPYLSKQPMRIYSSLWNGDSWATRGGIVKIDWAQAPFVASYTGYKLDACVDGSVCSKGKWWSQATYQTLDSHQSDRLMWVQKNYMIYNYCTDAKRYPVSPPECTR